MNQHAYTVCEQVWPKPATLNMSLLKPKSGIQDQSRKLSSLRNSSMHSPGHNVWIQGGIIPFICNWSVYHGFLQFLASYYIGPALQGQQWSAILMMEQMVTQWCWLCKEIWYICKAGKISRWTSTLTEFTCSQPKFATTNFILSLQWSSLSYWSLLWNDNWVFCKVWLMASPYKVSNACLSRFANGTI